MIRRYYTRCTICMKEIDGNKPDDDPFSGEIQPTAIIFAHESDVKNDLDYEEGNIIDLCPEHMRKVRNYIFKLNCTMNEEKEDENNISEKVPNKYPDVCCFNNNSLVHNFFGEPFEAFPKEPIYDPDHLSEKPR